MLFHVPIEKYSNRYTAEWKDIFSSHFGKCHVEETVIYGPYFEDNDIDQGVLLDVFKTVKQKNEQLERLINRINAGEVKDGDVIFFSDLWFPGIEMLFYLRSMLGIKFKIGGIFHAGTYDENDFTVRNGFVKWARSLEASWLSEVDFIFVSTEYHKQLIERVFGKNDRIFVTGLPFSLDDINTAVFTYCSLEEVNIHDNPLIIFPHRNDLEKQPKAFELLSNDKDLAGYNCRFTKTLDVCKTREEYFKLLGTAAFSVSFAKQETFGFSMLESMAYGAIPIVPDRLSYSELFPTQYKYRSTAEGMEFDYVNAKNLILQYLTGKLVKVVNPNAYLGKFKYSIERMVDIMRYLDAKI